MTVAVEQSPADQVAAAPARRHLHQHHPHPLHGRRPGRQLGPPGHTHGHGAGGVLPLAIHPPLRPARPDLAQPRPLRALRRPCLDALVFALAPDRRQGGEQGIRAAGRGRRCRSRRSRSSASGTAGARGTPSIAGPRGSRRRPARSARGRRTRVGMAAAERWMAARFNKPGLREADRLQRLRPLRRRRHDGGDHLRGRLARRALEALEPLLDLRQQPHHHRGEHGAGVQRGRGDAVPRLRLERHPRRRRQRPGYCSTGRSRCSSRRTTGRP